MTCPNCAIKDVEIARLKMRIEMFTFKRKNWPRHRPPRFGYRSDPNVPGQLVGHPPDIDIIKLIMRMSRAGVSGYKISRHLDTMTFTHRPPVPRSLVHVVIQRGKAGEYDDILKL